MYRSSLKDQGLYKPSFAGFVDVDLKDQKISLRTLVSVQKRVFIYIYIIVGNDEW